MISNPNHVCVDTHALEHRYPETLFSFTTDSGLYGSELCSFTVDAKPVPNSPAATELTDAWRICTHGSNGLIPAFEAFANRNSYDASRSTVIYACELGDGQDNKYATAPISAFMKEVGKELRGHMNSTDHLKDQPLYLLATHNSSVEKFMYNPKSDELVSVPHIGKRGLIPIKSHEGLDYLSNYLASHLALNADRKYKKINDETNAVEKLLRQVGATVPEPLAKGTPQTEYMARAEALLGIIGEEKAKLAPPPTSYTQPKHTDPLRPA